MQQKSTAAASSMYCAIMKPNQQIVNLKYCMFDECDRNFMDPGQDIRTHKTARPLDEAITLMSRYHRRCSI